MPYFLVVHKFYTELKIVVGACVTIVGSTLAINQYVTSVKNGSLETKIDSRFDRIDLAMAMTQMELKKNAELTQILVRRKEMMINGVDNKLEANEKKFDVVVAKVDELVGKVDELGKGSKE
jgi:hypothetical protein